MTGLPDIEAAVEALCPQPLETIDGRAIGLLLGQSPGYYMRSCNRRALEADGFPRAISRGRWLKRDVIRYIVRRSRGLPTAVAANDDAGVAPDGGDGGLDAALRRTRAHLRRRRP